MVLPRNALKDTGRNPTAWACAAALGAAWLAPAPVFAQGSWEIGYSFPAPTSQTNGLTWDGEALWHTNDRDPIIYRINPDGGAVLGEIGTQVPDQGDLEFAGGAMWVVSENDHYIHKVDPSTGKTLDSIKVLGIPESPPGSRFPIQMEGLTFDGRNIWVDGGTNYIIRIDLVKRTQHMYIMPLEMGYLDGMTWAFDHLWVVTNNATIYELDPCSMGILDRFDAPAHVGGGPEGFAFDGENLWFADNDRDQIYKIILKDKILTKRAASRDGAASVSRRACNEGILLEQPTVAARRPSSSQSGRARTAGTARAIWTAPDGSRDALGRRPLPSHPAAD